MQTKYTSIILMSWKFTDQTWQCQCKYC